MAKDQYFVKLNMRFLRYLATVMSMQCETFAMVFERHEERLILTNFDGYCIKIHDPRSHTQKHELRSWGRKPRSEDGDQEKQTQVL